MEDDHERPRALIVEDNDVNRMVARQMLKRASIDADEAEGGHRALELLGQNTYDVVLMDVQMPGMDGLETARAIRELAGPAAKLPIIAMTAYASEEDQDSCFAAGMDAYLSKPLNMQKFLDTVAAAIDGRLEPRE
jgi:CheY-like chemotaxis protein